MARRLEQPPRSMFRGSELRLMATAVLLLIMLGVLMTRWGKSNRVTPPADSDAKPASTLTPTLLPQRERTSTAIAEPTGPTDEESLERAEARREFPAITDGTAHMDGIEMPVYYRFVKWVANQPFARLQQRARPDLRYTHFFDETNKYRGQLVTMKMRLSQAVDRGDNNDLGIDLYEIAGSTRESGSRLYAAMVVDYPKSMPSGSPLDENVRFVGYFLKLQRYQTGDNRWVTVPLLIGRLQWEPPSLPQSDNRLEWALAALLLIIVGVGLGVRLVVRRRRQSPTTPAPRGVAIASSGETVPIEVWLEQCAEKGTGPIRRNGPEAGTDAQRWSAHKLDLSPFPLAADDSKALDGPEPAPDH
jgi:hypothetical protein